MKFEKVFSTPFFDIEAGSDPRVDRSEPYYRMTGSDSVICCVLTSRGEFVFVEQYRPNLDQFTLEFPAGGIEKGESAIDAAQRELLEESGMRCPLLALGSYRLMMNRSCIMEHIFWGVGATLEQSFEREHGIETKLLNREEFINSVCSGQYKQLAGLGVLQLISLNIGLDVLLAPLSDIKHNFNTRMGFESRNN